MNNIGWYRVRRRVTYEHPGGISTGVFSGFMVRFLIRYHRIGSIRIKELRSTREPFHYAKVQIH